MFALADATLLRPLPFPQADRLVMVWERNSQDRNPRALRVPVSPINLRDWREQSRSFDAMAAMAMGIGGGPLLAAPDGTLQSVDRQTVTSRFFDVLGVTPVLGRTFLPSDAAGATTTVVLMGEGTWRTRFGADPSVVGREVRLNGQPFTVIGIVPDHAQLARAAGIWSLMPEQFPPNLSRGLRFLQAVGRLKPGVSLDAAQADLSVIADSLAQAHPDSNKGWGVTVDPLRSAIMGRELQLTSIFLLGVVGFVLLMCCANVANLLLARASVRGRELAVRSALGAGRTRIVAQLLTESVVLAALGGVLGIGIGAAILKVAPTLIPAGLLPVAATVAFDGRVLLFCGAASVIVGVLFGLVPAWQATRTSLVQALSSESRSATRGGGRFRSVLVAGEIAAAVLLLCGAGLLLRTLLVLGKAETGYRANGDTVMTLDFSLPAVRQGTRYPTAQSYMSFYDSASSAIRALPGVQRIGWSTGLPYGDTELGSWRLEIVGDPPVAPANRPIADFQAADPGYFETLDLPIVAGRNFTDSDTSTSTLVCIVNEAFVRRHLAGRNPIGVRVAIEPALTNAAAPRGTRDRRRRTAVERPRGRPSGPGAALRAVDTVSRVRHPPGRPGIWRACQCARGSHPHGDRKDRQQRSRQARAHAHRFGEPDHCAASVQGGDGWPVRQPRLDAGDGRHLRRAGVCRRAADPRVRRSHRARCVDNQRASTGARQRRSSHRRRRPRRARGGGGALPNDLDVSLWR